MTLQRKTLGDICKIEKGNIGIMKAIPGQYPLVVLGEERKTHNEYQFDNDAVVIPLVSSTGHGHRSMKRIFFQSGKFSVGSILCAVIPKDKKSVSAEYLYRYLDLVKERELVSRMRGMANVTLPMSEIAKVAVPLPDFREQTRLIEFFKALEADRDRLRSEIGGQLEMVARLRQAFLREAMQGKLFPQDPADEPASVLVEKIKTEKTRLIAEKTIKKEKPLLAVNAKTVPFEVPSSWSWCRMGELGEATIGLTYKPSQVKASGIPVLRANNVVAGKIVLEGLVKVETPIRESQMAKIGDIVICVRSGSSNLIGKSATVKSDGLSFGAFMTLYRSRLNAYIQHFLFSDLFKKQIDDKKSTGINQLTQETLRNILIPLPPLAEQMRIVEKLEKLMTYCDELEANIRASMQHAETLLQVAAKEVLETGGGGSNIEH